MCVSCFRSNPHPPMYRVSTLTQSFLTLYAHSYCVSSKSNLDPLASLPPLPSLTQRCTMGAKLNPWDHADLYRAALRSMGSKKKDQESWGKDQYVESYRARRIFSIENRGRFNRPANTIADRSPVPPPLTQKTGFQAST